MRVGLKAHISMWEVIKINVSEWLLITLLHTHFPLDSLSRQLELHMHIF